MALNDIIIKINEDHKILETAILQEKVSQVSSMEGVFSSEITDVSKKLWIEAKNKEIKLKQNLESQLSFFKKQQRLAMKTKLLDIVYNRLFNYLLNLSSEQYLSWLKEKVLALKLNEGTIHIGNINNGAVNENFLASLANFIKKDFPDFKIPLQLSNNIQGGFVLENGNIQVNVTFTSILDDMKEQEILNITSLLFESSGR